MAAREATWQANFAKWETLVDWDDVVWDDSEEEEDDELLLPDQDKELETLADEEEDEEEEDEEEEDEEEAVEEEEERDPRRASTSLGKRQAAADTEKLSEYELLRLSNMQRNAEILIDLGLANPTASARSSAHVTNPDGTGARKRERECVVYWYSI